MEILERILYIYSQRYAGFIAIAFLVYGCGWICSILLSLMLGNDIRIDGFSINYKYVIDLFAVVDDEDGSGNNNAGHNIFVSSTKAFFYLLECFIYYVFCCIAHGASIWYVVHLYFFGPVVKEVKPGNNEQLHGTITSEDSLITTTTHNPHPHHPHIYDSFYKAYTKWTDRKSVV